MNEKNAPWGTDAALRLLVGRDGWESAAGDLVEEYRDTASPARGRFWYWMQVISFANAWQLGVAGGALAAIAIVVGNVALPAAGINFAYSEKVEVVCNAVCAGCLLLLWIAAGVAGRRREHTLGAAVRSGATLALVQVAIVMLTFFVINNLFLSIVSRQPDKLWDFQHSGASSMRTFINYVALRGLFYVLPVCVAVGAVCGGVGGLLGLRFPRRLTAG